MKRYGMRLRPAGPGCQPPGFIRIDSSEKRYWNVLYYERELTKEEMEQYNLDELPEIKIAKTTLLRKPTCAKEYDMWINKVDYLTEKPVIIAKELIWTKDQIKAFEENMLEDHPDIEALDLNFNKELQMQEVAWIHEEGQTGGWYVDNQGYSYARYAGRA